jgi:fatty-acyl-CoA synthase
MIDVAKSGSIDYDTKELRLIRSGGSPYPRSLVEGIHTFFDCHFLNTFGMTENLSNVTTMHSGIDPEEAWTTIGKPTYFWGLRAVRIDEAGEEAGPDDIVPVPGRGQIILRGPQNVKEYYCSSEKPLMKDDWLFARDVVDVDERGYMQIVDRVDESIISGGENIYPQEVELFLKDHPMIADVAVFGIPNKKWGEKIAACVVRRSPELTEEGIEKFCLEGENLAKYKRPRQIFFVDKIPKNVLGKTNRRKLREELL